MKIDLDSTFLTHILKTEKEIRAYHIQRKNKTGIKKSARFVQPKKIGHFQACCKIRCLLL